MTKKDYIVIAEAIRDYSVKLQNSIGLNQQYYDLIDDLIDSVSSELHKDNNRFDKAKFYQYVMRTEK